ncbi:MAG: phage regulatory CII family protein [Gammaproteobacteria bacterium]
MQELMRAIYEVVDDHGATKIAQGASFSSRTLLSQKVNPDYDSHKLNVEELHRIMAFTGDTRPLKAWAEHFGFDLTPRVAPEAKNLTSALLHMSAEVADVTRAVTDALDDGHVSQTEKQLIKRELLGARQSLDVLETSVKAA